MVLFIVSVEKEIKYIFCQILFINLSCIYYSMFMKYPILLFVFIMACVGAHAQELMKQTNDGVPLKALQYKLDSLYSAGMQKTTVAAKTTASIYDTSTFRARIDSWWGVGVTTAEKLQVFDSYWKNVDSFYGGFVGLPMYDWNSITNAMRAEIASGVSRGRFAGILGKLTAYLNDGHSGVYDFGISTGGLWGRPIFYGPTGAYGACVTMLADSTAMVYTSMAGNALNLQPGDRVLGYNGIPWKTLVNILLQYEAPVLSTKNSTDSATWHKYICSVLGNFLMFDTINIEKCDGSLVNFATSVMYPGGYMGSNLCTEQMAVPGVQTMSYEDYYTNNKMITSGVITGKDIGYVAMYDCGDFTGDSLYNHIKTLVEDSVVDGLIIDIRTNYGGTLLSFRKAFEYLYAGDQPWIGCAYRDNPANKYTMDPYLAPPSSYGLTDIDPHSFDKKIALLVGPGSISAGDMMQVLYTHHPKLKTFGKPTAGAFGGVYGVPVPDPFFGNRQGGSFYTPDNYYYHLSHHNFSIDSFVWFDKASTCAGKDKVLETAIKWIKPELGIEDIKTISATAKVYPNPSYGAFNILLQSPVATTVTISLLNTTGAEKASISATVSIGENKLRADFSGMNLPVGSYQIVIRGNGMATLVRKVTVLR